MEVVESGGEEGVEAVGEEGVESGGEEGVEAGVVEGFGRRRRPSQRIILQKLKKPCTDPYGRGLNADNPFSLD